MPLLQYANLLINLSDSLKYRLWIETSLSDMVSLLLLKVLQCRLRTIAASVPALSCAVNAKRCCYKQKAGWQYATQLFCLRNILQKEHRPWPMAKLCSSKIRHFPISYGIISAIRNILFHALGGNPICAYTMLL